jgi:hypothetical protein
LSSKLGFKLIDTHGVYLENIVLTGYILKFESFTFQFPIFYERGEFYWTGNMNNNNVDSKWFGDVDRGMNM